MLRINRFNENKFDLEEITNIFTSLTDEGFHISCNEHTWIDDDYLTINLICRNGKFYIT